MGTISQLNTDGRDAKSSKDWMSRCVNHLYLTSCLQTTAVCWGKVKPIKLTHVRKSFLLESRLDFGWVIFVREIIKPNRYKHETDFNDNCTFRLVDFNGHPKCVNLNSWARTKQLWCYLPKRLDIVYSIWCGLFCELKFHLLTLLSF